MKLLKIAQEMYDNPLLNNLRHQISKTAKGRITAEWKDLSFDTDFGTKEEYGWETSGEIEFTAFVPEPLVEQARMHSGESVPEIIEGSMKDTPEFIEWLNRTFVDGIEEGPSSELSPQIDIKETSDIRISNHITIKGHYSLESDSPTSPTDTYKDEIEDQNADI